MDTELYVIGLIVLIVGLVVISSIWPSRSPPVAKSKAQPKPDAVEDSPSVTWLDGVTRPENHQFRYRVRAVVVLMIAVGLILFNANRLSGFEAIGMILFAIALAEFMLAIGLVSELLRQIRDK